MELADLTGDVRTWIDRLGLSMEEAARHVAVDVEKLDRVLSSPELGVTTRELLQVIDGLGLGLADVRPLTAAKVIHSLDRARAAKSMTQKELARVSGINRTHLVALFKQPNPNPKAETVVRLAAAIGCPLTIVKLRELPPLPAIAHPIAIVDAPVATAANAPTPLAAVENDAPTLNATAAMHATAPTPRAPSATSTTTHAAAPSPWAVTFSATSSGAAAMQAASPSVPAPARAHSPTTEAVNAAATANVSAATTEVRFRSGTGRLELVPLSTAGARRADPSPAEREEAHKCRKIEDDLRAVREQLARAKEQLAEIEREKVELAEKVETDARTHRQELARAEEHTAAIEVAGATKARNTGLVAGGAATLGAVGAAAVLDRVAPENRPAAQVLVGGAGSLLVAGGLASESKSVVRWGALAAGVGILGGLIYDALRVRDRDAARGGVGVEVNFLGDALDITAVDPDSPAARAGLLIGDKIIAINDRGVVDSGAEKAAERLVGPIGETVALKVIRISPWSLIEVKLTREAKA